MNNALTKKNSCASICSKDCVDAESDESDCGGNACPFTKVNKVYDVYYFTVEHDFDKGSSPPSPATSEKSSKFK
jgi:hypothetical protein